MTTSAAGDGATGRARFGIMVALGWGLLALWSPAGFVILALLGARALISGLLPRRVVLLIAICSGVILVGTSGAPVTPTGVPTWLASTEYEAAPNANLLSFGHMRTLQGYDPARHAFAYASRDPVDGSWTVPLRDARDGAPVPRFRSTLPIEVRGGLSYRTQIVIESAVPPPPMRLRVRTDDGNVSAPFVASEGVSVGDYISFTLDAEWTAPMDSSTAWPVDVILGSEVTPSALTIRTIAVHEIGDGPVLGVSPPADGGPGHSARAWGLRMLAALVMLAAAAGTRAWGYDFVAAYALAAGISVHATLGVVQVVLEGGSRANGFAAHPNLFAHETLVLAALAWLVGGLGPGRVAIVAAAVAVGTSGGRGAFAALLILTLAVAQASALRLPSRTGVAWRRRSSLLAAAVFVLALAGAALFVARGDALLDEANVLERRALWAVAWEAVRAYPLTGIGFERFAAYAADHRPPLSLVRRESHPHSIGLGLLTELGIPGTLALVATWAALARWAASHGRRLAVLLLVVGALNVFDTTLLYTPVYLALWAAFGFALRTPAQAVLSQAPRADG